MELTSTHGISLLKFSPSQLHIEARLAGPRSAVPQTATQALRSSGAQAVLDGPMFDICDGQPDDYASYQCGLLLYRLLDRSRGIDNASARVDRGITVSIVNGAARVLGGEQVVPGANVAVQLYPPLVVNGANVANPDLNEGREWRAALAVMRDGQLAFAAGPMSMFDFASALRDAGALYAGYTDGGGSAKLAMGSGAKIGAQEDRRIPAWLTVSSDGPSKILVLGGLAALGVGTWLAVRP